MKIKHDFKEKEMIKFKDNKLSSPQIDAIEEITDKGWIYEAKNENKVALSHIIQLYGNFILAIQALSEESKQYTPVLLIHVDNKYKLSQYLIETIKCLKNNSKIVFPLEVWNYQGEVLFPESD